MTVTLDTDVLDVAHKAHADAELDEATADLSRAKAGLRGAYASFAEAYPTIALELLALAERHCTELDGDLAGILAETHDGLGSPATVKQHNRELLELLATADSTINVDELHAEFCQEVDAAATDGGSETLAVAS
ncbi:hypothetical protein JNJ66_07815 [Candidatus Saccharibacteria bacterium]|nr:hypothetical protein [Candidatus Saccharibacteria bacterium]